MLGSDSTWLPMSAVIAIVGAAGAWAFFVGGKLATYDTVTKQVSINTTDIKTTNESIQLLRDALRDTAHRQEMALTQIQAQLKQESNHVDQ
jgi:hypothetical protein